MEEKTIVQENGVVLTVSYLFNNGNCIDIEIPDNVERLVLGTQEDARMNYNLRGVLKCFPQVKEILILENVGDIKISNFMFPNVRKVVSQNNWYETHQALLLKTELQINTSVYLLNTFCLEAWEEIEFGENISEIYFNELALEGCRSESIFRSEIPIDKCEARYLRGSSAMIRPSTDGVFASGKYVLKYDSAEEIVLPPEASMILDDSFAFETIEKCTIQNINHIDMLPDVYIKTLSISGTPMLDIMVYWLKCKQTENYQISPDHPYYRTIDGVLYTKDCSTLVLYPAARRGHFSVPEGVLEIGEFSFGNSFLESVSFPDSLIQIREYAFRSSKIKDVDFGKGVRIIGEDAFSGCRMIKRINIPGSVTEIQECAFSNCATLQDVVLNDGLVKIKDNVFSNCEMLKSLSVPKTVTFFKNGQLMPSETIVFEGDRIPKNFLSSTFAGENRYTKDVQTVRIGNKHGKYICLPRDMEEEAFSSLLKILFVSQLFEQDFIDNIPNMTMDLDVMDDLIIDCWNTFSNDAIREQYRLVLRRHEEAIFKRLFRSKEEKRLLSFLKTGAATKEMLAEVLHAVPENMVELRTSILQASTEEPNAETMAL